MMATDLAGCGENFEELVGRRTPFVATQLGISGFNALVPDISDEGSARIASEFRRLQEATRSVAARSESEGITREVLMTFIEHETDLAELRDWQFQAGAFGGSAHSMAFSLVPRVRLTSTDDELSYLTRLGGLDRYFRQAGEQLQQGTSLGRTPVRRSLLSSQRTLMRYLQTGTDDDVFLSPALGTRIEGAVRRLVVRRIRPAVESLALAFTRELAPTARDEQHMGVCWLPDGEQIYGVYSRVETTSALTPRALQSCGLEVLESLEAEFAILGAEVFGTSQPKQVRERLRDDPRVRLMGSSDLLTRAQSANERASRALSSWVDDHPASPCEVQLMNAGDAATLPSAVYSSSQATSGLPGIYRLNADLCSSFQIEAVSFHEGTLGHHLQISIAQAAVDLPQFRRLYATTAFSEGWACYAERLADEMHLYTSAFDRLGMVCHATQRACRIVVDTGIHFLGWTFAHAFAFLEDRAPMPLSSIRADIDRIVDLPGQTLGYTIGHLEIATLRRDAEALLGARFDIRTFHDALLRDGSLPLGVLRSKMDRWIDATNQ